ncbi:MAG: orotate phosphoribosyltransferase [Candidatus Bathyarchaeia archaeon]
MHDELDFCKILLKTGAVKFGIFKLTSGKISSYYIDLRLILSFPEALKKVIEFYEKLVTSIGVNNFQRIAGIPTAGIPFASILAFKLNKPFIYVRKEAKPHGRERRIEGILYPGDEVLIVDDLTTTGKSMLNAISAIKAEGGIVTYAIVLIDREENAREKLMEENVELKCFMKISDVAKKLLELGAIDVKEYEKMVKA